MSVISSVSKKFRERTTRLYLAEPHGCSSSLRRAVLRLRINNEEPARSTKRSLITGEVDHRTPISESEQLYQALKLRKIDAALVRIPSTSRRGRAI